jgi:hypothetical protein
LETRFRRRFNRAPRKGRWQVEATVYRAAKAFGLNCRSFRKEKSAFLCQTDKGAVLVESARDPANIEFQHRLKTMLSEGGFSGVDTFFLSDSGAPYAYIDNEAFTAKVFHNRPEADFADAAQFKRIIRKSARMHRLLRGVPVSGASAPPEPERVYERDLAALRRYKKQIYKTSPLSEFDVALLQHVDF